jgi:hypothetical protein
MTGWIVFGVVAYALSHLYVYREGWIRGRQEILDELLRKHAEHEHELTHQGDS